MTWDTIITSFCISLLASILGVGLVLWFDRQRRPRLKMAVSTAGTIDKSDPLKRPTTTFLHVRIENAKTPFPVSLFYDADIAHSCAAWITFHHLDGHKVFDREMVARWTGTPEPVVRQIRQDNKVVLMLTGVKNTVEIPTGESADLDVASRMLGERECYGWNNESYLYNWKHPDWKLKRGRYLVKVRVRSMGREFEDAFLLVNDVPHKDFRIELASKEYKTKLIG